MKKFNQNSKDIGLNSPSKITITLYSILAILLVVIPESMAELLLTIKNKGNNGGLKASNDSWEKIPELKLSRMSIKELREMAKNLNIKEYARDNRKILSKRLLN